MLKNKKGPTFADPLRTSEDAEFEQTA